MTKTWWLYVLYFAFRFAWLLTLPLTEAPDEANHLWVVRFLFDNMRLPTHEEVFAAGTPAVYGSLAQFGYAPHLLIAKFFPVSMLDTTARVGSIFIGVGTLWAAIQIGKELFADKPLYRMALPLLIVVHPQLVFVNSYINPDSTTITLTSIIFYLLVVAIKRGLTTKKSLLIGLLLGWVALAKQTGLVLIPAIFGGMAAALWLHSASLSTSAACLSFAFGSMTGISLWWFVRNFYEFGGDVFGSKTMYQTWSTILPRKDGVIVHPWPLITSYAWWRYVWFDFWGLFGYMNRYLWRPIYFIYMGITAASIYGWLPKPTLPKKDRTETAIWILFAVCILLHLGSMLYVTITNVSGPHGRYLFPSVIPVFALLLAGFSRLTPRVGNAITWLIIGLSTASTIGAWLCFYRP
ncbi:MAG: hypothetical protein K2Y22_09705 [Candidatus Obscuribacterales bacterium]|nr:hypothetical protein [Candidatus Obscuribacterales bacterium]